ncbi:MAG: hypothetical protein ACOX9E_01945 [Lentisphaeria bacterium]
MDIMDTMDENTCSLAVHTVHIVHSSLREQQLSMSDHFCCGVTGHSLITGIFIRRLRRLSQIISGMSRIAAARRCRVTPPVFRRLGQIPADCLSHAQEGHPGVPGVGQPVP